MLEHVTKSKITRISLETLSNMSDENSKAVGIPGKIDPIPVALESNRTVLFLVEKLQYQEKARSTLLQQLTEKDTRLVQLLGKFNVLDGLFNTAQKVEAESAREIANLKKRVAALEVENLALKSDKERACLWFLNKG